MIKAFLKLEQLIEPKYSGLLVIDVVCPSCGKKAIFKPTGTTSTCIVKPLQEGMISCGHCGLSKEYHLEDLKYFYHIVVRDRVLVARTKENFIKLKDFFNNVFEKKEHIDSTIDFPKIFYLKRVEIVKKIDKFLKAHG